ncbi:hypothetical protein POSPLADRAFT_1054255, partial [Postia placenta MAD-698-R-SB12]
MDPARSPHPPSDRPRAHRAPVSYTGEHDPSRPSTPGYPHSHTALPPIRHLHPDLPPAAMQGAAPTAGPVYSHPQSADYPVASGSTLGSRPMPDDSDGDGEQQEPPKKKRRRQALSCTECKRRKIKCDRAQPCGPCVRRGEHHKCQWHIIEPMEKYVTRTEYDELKAKVAELETLVHRLIPARPAHTPSAPSLAPAPYPDPLHAAPIRPYHPGLSASGPSSYYGVTPPPPPPPNRGEPPGSYNHIPKLVAPNSPSLSRPSTAHGASSRPAHMPPSPSPYRAAPSPPPAAPAPPPAEPGPPSRRASLSLAHITAPYHP